MKERDIQTTTGPFVSSIQPYKHPDMLAAIGFAESMGRVEQEEEEGSNQSVLNNAATPRMASSTTTASTSSGNSHHSSMFEFGDWQVHLSQLPDGSLSIRAVHLQDGEKSSNVACMSLQDNEVRPPKRN